MKTIWVKYFRVGHITFNPGIALEEWALPLEVSFWGGQSFCITVLCFYLGVEWAEVPDLASRMVETLKK